MYSLDFPDFRGRIHIMKEFYGINVLIVDDEVDICRTLDIFFRACGASTFIAHNGKEAFEIVKRERVDFVISDIKMPGGDGIELLKNIRDHDPRLPTVLIVTGFSGISREDAIKKGAVDLLTKPVGYDFIQKYIRESLQS